MKLFYHNLFSFFLQGGSSITFMITMKRLIITEFLTTMLPTILIVLVSKCVLSLLNYYKPMLIFLYWIIGFL